MPKRKAESDSEEEAQFSEASPESKPKSKPRTKKAATKEKQLESPREADSPKNHSEDRTSSRNIIQKNSEGEKYVDLGKKKRATVRSFKGIPLLDIREFYGAGSEEKPGKKGISLTREQWQVLRANAGVIDDLFTEISKGKK